MRRLSIFLVLCLSVSCTVLASSEWTGLWRVTRFYDEKPDGVHHIFITSEAPHQVTIYSDDGRPMFLQEMKISDDTFEFKVSQSEKQPLPLLLKATRHADQLEGEWIFSQFQLGAPVTGTLFGSRVLSVSEWDPWTVLRSSGRESVLDLAGVFLVQAEKNKFSKFESFFDREIEPHYYFLLEQWLYGSSREPRKYRRERLEKLYEMLRSKGPERTAIQQFPALVADALRARQKLSGSDSLPFFLVSFVFPESPSEQWLWTRVPTPEDEQTCACKLDLRERFVFFNPTRTDFAAQDDRLRLEAEIIYKALWDYPSPGTGIEIFRHGLALYLLLEGKELELHEPDTLPSLRGELKRDLLSAGLDRNKFFPGDSALSESPGYFLGYALVSDLSTRLSIREIKSLPDPEVMAQWIRFLGEASSANGVEQKPSAR